MSPFNVTCSLFMIYETIRLYNTQVQEKHNFAFFHKNNSLISNTYLHRYLKKKISFRNIDRYRISIMLFIILFFFKKLDKLFQVCI